MYSAVVILAVGKEEFLIMAWLMKIVLFPGDVGILLMRLVWKK